MQGLHLRSSLAFLIQHFQFAGGSTLINISQLIIQRRKYLCTYVFVETTDGTELVNPAQPSLEGKNFFDAKDLTGTAAVQKEIDAAMNQGGAWLECTWYKPGDNRPARKQTYVRKVQSGENTFIVGSGFYVE